MSNKIVLILLSGLLTFSLSAQKSRYRNRNRNRNETTATATQKAADPAAEKKTEQKAAAKNDSPVSAPDSARKAPGRFDPRKPMLTQKYVDSIMDGVIRKDLLERKLPSHLPGAARKEADDERESAEKKPEKKTEKARFLSQIDYGIIISRYESLIKHFEVSEVTNIRPEWFRQYLNELKQFAPILYEMSSAIQSGSNDQYLVCVEKFKARQEACLKFLKQKKPGLTTEERQELQKKNMQLRIENRRKQRLAEMKRREEQNAARQTPPATAPATAPAAKK